MGRWKFSSARWDEDANQLVLENASRIEAPNVKSEFLTSGEHIPRDIVLSTREMNQLEYNNQILLYVIHTCSFTSTKYQK